MEEHIQGWENEKFCGFGSHRLVKEFTKMKIRNKAKVEKG
jgi:hypothetical protein